MTGYDGSTQGNQACGRNCPRLLVSSIVGHPRHLQPDACASRPFPARQPAGTASKGLARAPPHQGSGEGGGSLPVAESKVTIGV